MQKQPPSPEFSAPSDPRRSEFAIAPRSLDRQAADVLRSAILNGDFPPGTRLLEINLSEQLNLSRGTIRTALQQLTYEGLVVQSPYRGCAVVGLSAQDAWELYTLRSALEALAARLTAEKITPDRVQYLMAALQRLKDAAASGNANQVADADFALHQTIIELSEHHRLQQQYRIVEQQIRLYIASCNALLYSLEEVVEQHIGLVEAICAGEGAIAEALARAHSNDGDLVVNYLRSLETE